MLLAAVGLLLAVSGCRGMQSAECVLSGNLRGTIHLQSVNNDRDVRIAGTVDNLTKGRHGFHIHENTATAADCKAAGAHYNPYSKKHGSITATERHEGDLENIMADDARRATFNLTAPYLKLEKIINRSIVIHENEDDLGLTSANESQTTGNAGGRLDCCTIRWAQHNSATSFRVELAAVGLALLTLFL